MANKRIYTVDYYEFKVALKQAIDGGHRIDPSDRQKWADYVRKHSIPEAAMLKRGEKQGMGGKIHAVIIIGDRSWDGYYVHSPGDQFSLKFDINVS